MAGKFFICFRDIWNESHHCPIIFCSLFPGKFTGCTAAEVSVLQAISQLRQQDFAGMPFLFPSAGKPFHGICFAE
jgi:hypothetical protein